MENKRYYIYNFGGETYETYEAFDNTYREKMREARAEGIRPTRQEIYGDRIRNQYYHPAGMWVDEE